MSDFDVVVIGAGPGGYVAAIRCAQLGLKTACVESWLNPAGKPALGGTCLNVGCIPSKALLDSSHHYEHLRKHAKEHGIVTGEVSFDVEVMQKRKEKIVQTLTQGIASLFKKNGVTWVQGQGALKSAQEVSVLDSAGTQTEVLRAKHIVIATGSIPAKIPPAPVDQQNIVDSTGALSFSSVPARLGVIGAGVIGLELGSVWRRLGAEVVVFEAMPEFLAAADKDIATEAYKLLTKQGLKILLDSKVKAVESSAEGVVVSVESGAKTEQVTVDKLIVAVGRVPNTQGLGAQEVGLALDERGFVKTDHECRTNLPGVYAIGDVTRGPMLAHKASEEGIAVAEFIAGQKPHIDHAHIPWVIYTWPEIAWAGATEQALKAAGTNYRVGRFPFMASGRARAMGETDGFIKIISAHETDEVLGVHILGPQASELIAEAVMAMSFSASAEDIARTVHAHPTLAEGMHEAALGTDNRMIHL